MNRRLHNRGLSAHCSVRTRRRNIVSAFLVTVILLGTSLIVFDVQSVMANYEIIYIRADGSIFPPAQNITTLDGVTYTFTNNITNHWIVVEKNNITIDGAGYTLQGTQASLSTGIDLTGITNVTVRDAQIKDFDYGIWLYNSSGNIISGNSLTNNNRGIWLRYSSGNGIIGNNVTGNLYSGIWFDGSSTDNSVSENNISNNPYGILVSNSYNNSIGENSITNNSYGVRLYNSSNNIVTGNKIADNQYGIHLLSYSSGNGIIGNNVTGNSYSGVYFSYSYNNTISENSISANNPYGILLSYSVSNSISGNSIADNNCGIGLGFSSNNFVSLNSITNNNYGIWLYKSSGNVIDANDITTNINYGIGLYNSSSNRFYHNYFIDNGQQVSGTRQQIIIYTPGYPNVWNNGYPSGGNYWSDYTDVDLYSGPNQNQSGSDYIWDHPYVIDPDNQDRYPLTNAWSIADVNHDGEVDAADAALVSAHWYPGPPTGPLGYEASYDINNDGKINVLEAAILSAYWTGPPIGPRAR